MTLGPFAERIFKRTYALDEHETWEGCSRRVAKFVANGDQDLEDKFYWMISERKFIPGGRYLYSAGRELPAVNNCLAGETKVLTKQGIKPIKDILGNQELLAYDISRNSTQWIEAKIKSFGIQALDKITIERAGIKKEIYATENHRWFVQTIGTRNKTIKEVTTKDLTQNNYYLVRSIAPNTNHMCYPSPIGIQHGIWYGDGTRSVTDKNRNFLKLCGDKDLELLKYFEPQFKINYDNENKPIIVGGPNFFKEFPKLDETRDYLLGFLMGYFAADGCVSKEGVVVYTSCSLSNIEKIKELCAILGIGTFSIRKQERISNLTNKESTLYLLTLDINTLTESFFLLSHHLENYLNKTNKINRDSSKWKILNVEKSNRIEEVYCAVVPNFSNFTLDDQILSGNCFMLRAEDSREGWADLIAKHMRLLSTGGGVGTYYNDIRPKGTPIKRFGGVASGPISLMRMVNEVAREVMAGGKRRSALLASLDWTHPDADEFIVSKNWNTDVKAMKERDFNNPAPLDMMNISVWIDPTFIKMLKDKDKQAWAFYLKIIKNMAKTGEPGFLIKKKDDDNEVLTNPCGETRSHLSGDVCNLGAIVLPRIKDVSELENITRLATEFLYLGSIHGIVADIDCSAVRDKSRRIGLGIMGLHEWLLLNNLNYEPNGKLGKWLSVYSQVSDETAKKVAAKYNGPEPMGRRVVAPTGTTSILAETTSGIEPVFCTAYKRRYLDDGKWKFSYVIDPTVERLVQTIQLDPGSIEDAYILSTDVERRISMQAYIQDYVDMAISSTINLPEFGEDGNNNPRKLGEILLKYLPRLRGITMYPDGARSGQPITPIKYETAKRHENVVFEENEENCKGGVCGV